MALVLLALLAACGGGEPDAAPGLRRGRAPGVGVGRLLIAWERGSAPRELVLIGASGVALGPAGGSLTRYLFASAERAADARFLAATFVPLEAETGQGRLRFAGSGRVRPSPAERRMIAEWARLAANEAAGGRVGGTYALVLAWHRGGAAGGECDDVAVYLTGEARAGSCVWGEELRGRLSPESLGRFYGWFDRYAPFQAAAEEESTGGPPSRLIFAGRGTAEVPARDREELERFAVAIHRELAARRPAPAAPPPAGTEPGAPGSGPSRPPAEPPAVPAVRLLRPPDPAPGRPAEIVVPAAALPKAPPPVPRPEPGSSSPPEPERPSADPRPG